MILYTESFVKGENAMTVVQFIMSTGVCTSGELLALKRTDPKDYDSLVNMAREQMIANGIAIEVPQAK